MPLVTPSYSRKDQHKIWGNDGGRQQNNMRAD